MASENPVPYILGIDLGSASLGWAAVSLTSDGEPEKLLRIGVRVFDPGVEGSALDIQRGKDQSRAVKRRQMRLQRRQIRRRAARRRELFELLQSNGLLPPYPEANSPATQAKRSSARHEILQRLDLELRDKWNPILAANHPDFPAPDHVLPYSLRARALHAPLEPYELGRALYHLGQRRGFKSNRRETPKTKEQEKEDSKVYQGISEISQQMQASAAPTLGAFFAAQNPEEWRIRRRWTARSWFEHEFEAIWTAQTSHHPQVLTPALRAQIRHLLFFQRPIAKQPHLIGTCELEPGRKRAPIASLAAQRFRLLQKVNDLRIRYPDFSERYLTAEERTKILDALERQGDLTFAKARTLLGLPKRGCWFNFEGKGQKDKLPGNRTAAKMIAAFGERWFDFSQAERDAIVEDWRSAETEEWLVKRGMSRWGLDEEHARLWASATVEDGYSRLSRKALSRLLPLMEEGFSFKEAEKEVYGARFSGGEVHSSLPPVRNSVPNLRNPAVERSLTELRKVVNAILREYRKPQEVHIELARDLKNPRQARKEIWQAISARRKQREEMAARLLKEVGIPTPSRAQIEKALLWEECKGECPYTGRKINFRDLFGDESQFDVEHILPFRRCPDDSFANKTLCYLPENRDIKRNRTPWESYGADKERWQEIVDRVKLFKNPGKLKRFLVKSHEELEQFTSRQLNDTRYASKLAGQYLGLLYGGRDAARADGTLRRVIHTSSGGLTAILRRNWGLEAILREPEPAASEEKAPKARSDHRHHAIDAIVIALSTPAAVKALSDAAERNAARGRISFKGLQAPWPDFVDSIRPHIESLIVSHRPEHKLSGPLHDESIYSEPYKDDGKTFVHFRKPVDSLSPGEVEQIVDHAVRAAVQKRLEELSDLKKLQAGDEEPPSLQSSDGRKIPIRSVRIRKALTTQPVGQGPRRRQIAPNNNHHMEIIAELDDRGEELRWEGVPVTFLEAMRRKREGRAIIKWDHGPGCRFKFSLMGGDTIELTQLGVAQLYVVRTLASNGQISLVRVNDARRIKEIKEAKHWWSPRADALRQLRARKVVVAVLGNVRPAHD